MRHERYSSYKALSRRPDSAQRSAKVTAPSSLLTAAFRLAEAIRADQMDMNTICIPYSSLLDFP